MYQSLVWTKQLVDLHDITRAKLYSFSKDGDSYDPNLAELTVLAIKSVIRNSPPLKCFHFFPLGIVGIRWYAGVHLAFAEDVGSHVMLAVPETSDPSCSTLLSEERTWVQVVWPSGPKRQSGYVHGNSAQQLSREKSHGGNFLGNFWGAKITEEPREMAGRLFGLRPRGWWEVAYFVWGRLFLGGGGIEERFP